MKYNKIYFGKKSNSFEDYTYCDISDTAEIMCEPWELSKKVNNVSVIYCEYNLEYLTNFEADRALRDWHICLKTHGTIKLLLTNTDYYVSKWLNANWDEDSIKDVNSDARDSFLNIWGDQENCDPWVDSYNKNYATVKKSAYNEKRIYFLLKRIGYENINIEILNEKTLLINASKPLGGGERQDAKCLDDIRVDHLKRYEFASSLITNENSIITDSACGVAYGSYILASNINVKSVDAIDISIEALNHGKKYFSNEKISYHQLNLEDDELINNACDYFISFETIEHLPNPEKYIEKISKNIKKDAIFIGSTPNEEIMPYTKYFAYHTKHFYVEELTEILKKCGFVDIKFYQQTREEPSEIEETSDGQYIIFTAKKV